MLPFSWCQTHDEFFGLSGSAENWQTNSWSEVIQPAGDRPHGCNHKQLLEVAAVALSRQPAEALGRFREAFRKMGKGYHETLTGCWLQLVSLALELGPEELSLRLAYSQLALAFYSPRLLNSAQAVEHFVSPDLKPIALPRRLPPAEMARLVAFQSGTLAKSDWTHECHLRVAIAVFLLLEESGCYAMSAGIQRLNQAHGVPLTPTGGYHETLTRVWFSLVARAVIKVGLNLDSDNLELWLRAVEPLQDKQLPLRFYSKERIMSWEARIGWLEPDLGEL